MKKTIWANTLAFNEDRYLWFAVKSVINFVDKILIWDTGSTDNTQGVIKLLQKKYSKKIIFRQVGRVDNKGLTETRKKMLKETKSDWLLLLDGDEVWWRDSIKKVISIINENNNLYALVVPVFNLVGDVYHYQEKEAGRYEILNRKGHLNLRAVNLSIPDLKIKNEYPLEGFYDENDKFLQTIDEKLLFIDAPILHFTHLPRSTKKDRGAGKRKIKYEIGIRFPDTFKYPEVLYEERPNIVPSPWKSMSETYRIRAAIETPLKKFKRRLK